MSELLKVLEEKLNGVISKEEFYRIIGDAIYDKRKLLGLSQAKLGKLVGLSRAVVANIEKGKPSEFIYEIYLIFKVLDIDISDLTTKIKRITKETDYSTGPNEKKFLQLLKALKLSETLYGHLIPILKYILGGNKKWKKY